MAVFRVTNKTLGELAPGKFQTFVVIERADPLKTIYWKLEDDWTQRRDDEIIEEVLEQDYRLTYGNRAEEEERNRVNALLGQYEKQLEANEKALKTSNDAVIALGADNALALDNLDILAYQIKVIAKHLGLDLPNEAPEEEEEEDEGKHEDDKAHDTEETGAQENEHSDEG